MSLDKAIEHGKEKRKPYRGAKAIYPRIDNRSKVDMKTLLIEEIESMVNVINQDVRKFNCGVD